MAYTPNNPNGQATAANSAPVVLASDAPVQVNQDDTVTLLGEIQSAVAALATTRGIAADIRVSVVNAPGVTVGSGNITVTGLGGTSVGGPYSALSAVPNWQNQTACQSFVNNIVRS